MQLIDFMSSSVCVTAQPCVFPKAVDGRGSDSSEIREWTPKWDVSSRKQTPGANGSDQTAQLFPRQLAAQWSTTRVSLCASSIRRRLLQRGLRARIPLYRIPLTQNHRRLRLHWANVHRSWRADWQHANLTPISDKSRFNLWYHDGRIRVRLYAGERRIPECIIERHSGRNTRSYGQGAISISWMITIATNCGKFEQYSIHKRSFTALRYSFPARIARSCIPAG
ncbi:transposable element Tcb1 transposase [Trichonephila clavipes]|nr:transposable element Tcb1 transposase [Trichonephila clavipes]